MSAISTQDIQKLRALITVLRNEEITNSGNILEITDEILRDLTTGVSQSMVTYIRHNTRLSALDAQTVVDEVTDYMKEYF
jgi:hypothetical protein